MILDRSSQRPQHDDYGHDDDRDRGSPIPRDRSPPFQAERPDRDSPDRGDEIQGECGGDLRLEAREDRLSQEGRIGAWCDRDRLDKQPEYQECDR